MREETANLIFGLGVLLIVPAVIGLPFYWLLGWRLGLCLHAGALALWLTSVLLTRGSTAIEHGIALFVMALVCAIFISSCSEAKRKRDPLNKTAASAAPAPGAARSAERLW